MENQKNYIQWIRSKVGHDKIILVFAGGAVELGETPQMAAVREVIKQRR